MNNDLKIIKKKFGEKMMQLCRELFSTILDNSPGMLPVILLETFAPSHYLYEDITGSYDSLDENYEELFKKYIYSIYERLRKNSQQVKEYVSDPVSLMKRVGYTLYECKCEEDIQKFKKYYSVGEELCTFNGGRLRRCHVYFAVCDNADKLKRSNFSNPSRQDEYGTSVISIQFTRDDSHTLSIKNRYNHTVNNPDATFSNDLDNIIPGLTRSFADYYGMIQRNYSGGLESFEMLGYVQADDGKLYKYNYEIDNVYYCPNNIVIDNFKVNEYEKEKYLVMDYFILDLVNKKFINQTEGMFEDSFVDTISDIKKITINSIAGNKEVIITPERGEDIIIILDKFNQIISFKNNNLVKITDNFLRYNETLEKITINNVIKIGSNFLRNNCLMKHLILPNVQLIAERFLENSYLVSISLPKVMCLGDSFMRYSYQLESIELPMVKIIGRSFLENNNLVKRISFPKVVSIGDDFLCNNNVLKMISLPKVISIGTNFGLYNQSLTTIRLPQVKMIGDYCLYKNSKLKKAILPNLELLGQCFASRSMIDIFYAPSLKLIDFSYKFSSVELEQKNKKIYKLINS